MGLDGKRVVYTVGFLLNLAAFVLLFVAFSSSYWFQSWPRVHSGFKHIGLWEACFAGLIIERDPSQKAYHGCWWVLAPEYWHIREYLMPWWFVITQIVCTLCLVVSVIHLLLGLIIWFKTGEDSRSGTGKKRAPFAMIGAVTVLTIMTAILMTGAVILFGTACYVDHMWMPRPDLNYLSWSYGVAVLSAFFSIFSSFAHLSYNSIVRQEFREPPPLMAPPIPYKDSAL